MNKAMLYKKLDQNKVHCFLCAHHCVIEPENYGFCGVRKNIDGSLYTYSYGKLIASNSDPIEKKPLYHFLPGSKSYSIATFGCNFRCGFCQNWQISQKKIPSDDYQAGIPRSPEQIVQDAIQNKCESISFTYTEPTIFFEYAYDIAKEAKKAGLKTIFVSNGFMTHQAIDFVKEYLDACNIDLKSFNEKFYQKFCQGHLRPVLDSIKRLHDAGIWLEITTLLITGENDSPEEINQIASFIATVDRNIPWHISRFFPQYEFLNHEATQLNTLKDAEKIGEQAGLNFVYTGNIPEETNTNCPKCNEILINRDGYKIRKNVINEGKCPKCETLISGVWK